MKFFAPIVLVAVAAAGCASSMPSPGGLPAGKFATLTCAENKTFQVRMSDDARTARVRSHSGAAELERQADGSYSGDGYVLKLPIGGAGSLDHSGKSEGKGCKLAS